MEKKTLICDWCGKEESGSSEHFNLPEGWMVLGFHSQKFVAPDDWRITHHYCSSQCMDYSVKITKESQNDR